MIGLGSPLEFRFGSPLGQWGTLVKSASVGIFGVESASGVRRPLVGLPADRGALDVVGWLLDDEGILAMVTRRHPQLIVTSLALDEVVTTIDLIDDRDDPGWDVEFYGIREHILLLSYTNGLLALGESFTPLWHHAQKRILIESIEFDKNFIFLKMLDDNQNNLATIDIDSGTLVRIPSDKPQ
jgi:hypothetical protein